MRFFYGLFILLFSTQSYCERLLHSCQFFHTFYQTHPNIFKLDRNRTSLFVRSLYSLTNESFSTLSIGIIYQLANTELVPVPLLFQCSQSERIYTPIDCQFKLIDIRSNSSIRTSESTRIITTPLNFQEYSLSNFISIRGAYFKQSVIALHNCRFDTKDNLRTSEIFYLNIQFEQPINSSCQNACLHPQLYECSPITNTCQCRSRQFSIEKFEQFCVDTELGSNCSRTPERCRRLCRVSHQIQIGEIDRYCQCPLGMQRLISNNQFYCESSIKMECINEKSILTCPNGYICQQNRCVHASILLRLNVSILSYPFIFIGLLMTTLLIIIILIISLIKMRSIKCVTFVHPYGLNMHSSNVTPILNVRLSSLSSTTSSTLSSKSTCMNEDFCC